MQYNDEESSIEEQSFKSDEDLLDEPIDDLDDLEPEEISPWGSDEGEAPEGY